MVTLYVATPFALVAIRSPEDDCPVAAASSSERVPGSPVSSPIAAWTTTDPGRFPSRISGARSTAARIATARPVFMSAAPRP